MVETAVPFRSLSAADAVMLALREADRLGVRLVGETVGGTSTTVSRLIRAGQDDAIGIGKGSGWQGVASAHFEALERYLMSARENRRYDPGRVRFLTASEVADQDELRPDLVIQRWAAEFATDTAACAAHHRAGSSVWYPVFLTDPRYYRHPLPGDSVSPYRSMLRYSSSLGTAAGATAAEAILHGLSELVEHDSVSLALLRWFIDGDLRVERIPPDALPDELRSLLRRASTAAAAPVHLIDVTTDLGVPAYIAVAPAVDHGATLMGAGASVSSRYAAQRALDELIQCSTVAKTASGTRRPAHLAQWYALQQCAVLPVSYLLSGTVRDVPLRDTSDDGTDLERSLNDLSERLSNRGVAYYVCDLTPRASLIDVAATIAPGLERFSLVRLDVPVIPTGRGWPIWRRSVPTPAPRAN